MLERNSEGEAIGMKVVSPSDQLKETVLVNDPSQFRPKENEKQTLTGRVGSFLRNLKDALDDLGL